MKSFESRYGTTTLYTFHDETGNVYKWFCSGFPPIANGSFLDIIGTIKGHDEYRGQKQTVLTRCKVA